MKSFRIDYNGSKDGLALMFERLTEKGMKVMMMAQEEALRLNHHHIDTEFILLGMLNPGSGIAGKILQSAGLTLDQTRECVEITVGRGTEEDPSLHWPVSVDTQEVFKIASRLAENSSKERVSTKELLLGLLDERRGRAVAILQRMKVDVEALRKTASEYDQSEVHDGAEQV